MICAACGYEWNIGSSSCPRCGFHKPVTGQSHQSSQLSFDERVAPYFARSQSEGLAQMPGQPGGQFRTSFPRQDSRVSHPLTAPPGGTLPPRTGGPGLPLRPLPPGTLLRGGRYRMQELQSRQDWHAGAFEATWVGRDMLRDVQVMIREVGIPGTTAEQVLPIMRTATMALLSLQQYPQVTPLVDAFSDQGRSFFLFELVPGETLMDYLRRLQRPLPEQEVVDFCLQLSEILETLHRVAPALVHGAIRPEHIYRSYHDSRYVLGNFSLLVAGRATQLVAGDRTPAFPSTAPEFAQGSIDTRSDIYAVLATAYHMATASVPPAGVIPPAQSLNPAISPALSALLARGLHVSPQQRYQLPSQLRQDLLAMRTQASGFGEIPALSMQGDIADSFPPLQEASVFPSRPFEFASSAPYLFPILPPPVLEEEHVLVPAPETLPPLRTGHERLEAVLMVLAALLALGLITALSNFRV